MSAAATTNIAPRRRRNTKACARCRKRKTRCDLQYPVCGACSTAGVTCSGFDSIQGIDKPRSLVRHLEQQIASLELDLATVKSQQDTRSDDLKDAVDRLTTDLAFAIVDPTGRGRTQDEPLSLTSSFFLSESPLPYFSGLALDGIEQVREQAQSSRAIVLSSIPRRVIDAMLIHYCETYRPQYPAIDEADLYKARDRIYENPQLTGNDAFVICITLAISSNTLMHIDEKRATTTAHGLWKTAVDHLQQVGLTNSWERLQALQLLTHYSFLNPQHVNTCHCAGAASRLAVQLGLHEELPTPEQMTKDASFLNTRRRMFWNAYGIDAAVHTLRCRPFKWSRPEITTRFPDSEHQTRPTQTAHMWSLREIECEITLGLLYPISSQSSPDEGNSFDLWLVQTQKRLDDWYQTVRQSITLTEKIEFHEVLYQSQVLRLYRPSFRCPTPSTNIRSKAVKASIALIRGFSIFNHLGKMFMVWHAAHCLIEAGVYLLTLLLMEVGSPNRDRQQQVDGQDLSIIVRYIKILPDLIRKIARRWSNMEPYVLALESISSSVLHYVQQWSEGNTLRDSEFASLKAKLDEMTLFSATPLRHHLSSNHMEDNNYRDVGTYSHLPPQSYHYPNVPSFPMTTSDRYDFANDSWLPAGSTLNQNLPFFLDTDLLEYGDPATWDFSGVESDEIFAAFLN